MVFRGGLINGTLNPKTNGRQKSHPSSFGNLVDIMKMSPHTALWRDFTKIIRLLLPGSDKASLKFSPEIIKNHLSCASIVML